MSETEKYRCSFCGKSQDEVDMLVRGFSDAFMCKECILYSVKKFEIKEKIELQEEKKFIVHISGPDDIMGPYTELEAYRWANGINNLWVKVRAKEGDDTPLCVAVVNEAERSG
jgi:hypothetical protein